MRKFLTIKLTKRKFYLCPADNELSTHKCPFLKRQKDCCIYKKRKNCNKIYYIKGEKE